MYLVLFMVLILQIAIGVAAIDYVQFDDMIEEYDDNTII
jgi:hypothetical protein